jgi:hypothetical protein
MTGRTRTWIDAERRETSIPDELARLRRRAIARPFRTLFVALAVAGSTVAVRAQKQRAQHARVVLRVTEEDLDAATAPRLKHNLRDYVLTAAFTNARLIALMQKYDLYTRRLAADPAGALESIREDIEVEVYRNYFIEERTGDDPGRSARIAISFTAKDASVALEVARRLGDIVVEQETAERQQAAREALEDATKAVQAAEGDLLLMRETLTRKEVELVLATGTRAAALRIEAEALIKQREELDTRLRQAEQAKVALALRADIEGGRLGLKFEVVDAGQTQRSRFSYRVELAATGIFAFFLILPLAIIAVGAFDSRVYDVDDVRRLGIVALGHIPSFRGDAVGSLRARTRRRRRRSG